VDIRHAVGVRMGLPESKLAALARYRESPAFAAREVAALEFAEQVARDDRAVSDACWAQLREHFSEPEAVELMFIVGYQAFASKFAKAFALVPQGLAPPAAPSPAGTAPPMAAAAGG
jgi:alkylhydroperoxidase family enzyme